MNLVDECKFLTEGWPYEEGHILPDESTCRMIYTILKLTRSKNVFEIGFNYGHSAYTFMNIDPSLNYHSVDIGQYEHTLVNAEKLKEMYPDRFEFTHMSSHDIDPASLSEYDMIFVDGDHRTDGMSRDLNLSNAAKPKYILIDDYVGCMSSSLGIYPKPLIHHFLSKPDFTYNKIHEFTYPSSDRVNHMVLLKREDL